MSALRTSTNRRIQGAKTSGSVYWLAVEAGLYRMCMACKIPVGRCRFGADPLPYTGSPRRMRYGPLSEVIQVVEGRYQGHGHRAVGVCYVQ